MINNKAFISSLLIPEIYFAYQGQNGLLVEVLEKVIEEQFYEAVEIGFIKSSAERNKVAALATESDIIVTQWMTSLIDEKNLDLSAVNLIDRQKAVRELIDYFYLASETGATNIAFVSGPFSGKDSIDEAKKSFYESLCQLCEEAHKYNMTILFEPLDRFAHKKKFMGPTIDAVEVIKNVREDYSNIGLAFDTAHAALNKESIEDALFLAQDVVEQIHFSNAVLDKESEIFGDHHIPIGEPGFLTVNRIIEILKKVKDFTPRDDNGLRIAIEVRNLGRDSVHSLANKSKEQLQKAIEIAGI